MLRHVVVIVQVLAQHKVFETVFIRICLLPEDKAKHTILEMILDGRLRRPGRDHWRFVSLFAKVVPWYRSLDALQAEDHVGLRDAPINEVPVVHGRKKRVRVAEALIVLVQSCPPGLRLALDDDRPDITAHDKPLPIQDAAPEPVYILARHGQRAPVPSVGANQTDRNSLDPDDGVLIHEELRPNA